MSLSKAMRKRAERRSKSEDIGKAKEAELA